MIIIFDTNGGLCNQFYDICCGVNFCIINNIKFSFRYCTFRNKNLTTWYTVDFNKLFSTILFEKYKELYVEIKSINLTDDNTYNYDGIISPMLFTDNYLEEIKNISKEYIILKQFWSTYKFSKIVEDINQHILPSKRLVDLYEKIKNKLFPTNENYNFIHYRYESDFVNYFNLDIKSLENIIEEVKEKFSNPNLKI